MDGVFATDGVVTLRAPAEGDASVLVAGRDEEWERWLGPGNGAPAPTAVVVVDGAVVGWVDFDVDRSWLEPYEVNVGYNVFPQFRRRGFATRAVSLLVEHLGRTTEYRTATLLIDVRNESSLAVASKLGLDRGDLDGHPYFKLPIPRSPGR